MGVRFHTLAFLPPCPDDFDRLGAINLDGAMQDGELAAGLAEIVMRGALRLKPLAAHADLVRHLMKFLQRVRQHMTHQHAMKGILGTINVNTHLSFTERTRTSGDKRKNVLK